MDNNGVNAGLLRCGTINESKCIFCGKTLLRFCMQSFRELWSHWHICDTVAYYSTSVGLRDWLPLAQTMHDFIHHCILSCSATGLAQMAAAHRGKRPLPLQLPGERGLLLSFFVWLGDGVWISLFSPSHFDLTPIPDSWYHRWTWHSTGACVEIWNGESKTGSRGARLKAKVSAVLCARQTRWPSQLNSAEEVTAHFFATVICAHVSASWWWNNGTAERMF